MKFKAFKIVEHNLKYGLPQTLYSIMNNIKTGQSYQICIKIIYF
jgi:hypothetical protein